MLVSSEVELPPQLREQLRSQAAFTSTFLQFAKDHIAGFQQPVAAAAAIILPVLLAFTHAVGGIFSAIEVAVTFGVTTALFLLGAWIAKRDDIAWAYSEGVENRRRASEDLRSGRGESLTLSLRNAPLFVEHDDGVIVLAEADDGRTLYFDIAATPEDPRWFLHVNGDLYRTEWSWLRLKGSGTVARFSARGQHIAEPSEPLWSKAPDTWDAISLALGEPEDGDLIDLSMTEASQTVRRLL